MIAEREVLAALGNAEPHAVGVVVLVRRGSDVWSRRDRRAAEPASARERPISPSRGSAKTMQRSAASRARASPLHSAATA